MSNGYRPNGTKISKAKTIDVPKSVRKAGIEQYVFHKAEELEREFKYGYSEDAETAFEKYAESWLARQVHYKASTLAGYQYYLKICCEFIGQIPLDKIRPITIENLCGELRKRIFRGKPISEQTVQKYLGAVTVVLSDAKRNEIISKNPAKMITLPKVEKRAQSIPSEDEMKQFIEMIGKMDEGNIYRLFFLLTIFTGCRRGEVAGLKWGDVIVCKAYIFKSVSYLAGQGIVVGKTKNSKPRVIPIPLFLQVEVSLLQINKLLWGKSCNPNEYIFTNEKGELLSPDVFSNKFRNFIDDNHFSKNYHLHTLRHFYATIALQNGISKQVVAELLGHGDTGFLERTYCHPQFDYKLKAIKPMERLAETIMQI